GFNFIALDITKSRSFGVITKNRRLVQEAIKLFEADSARQPYRSAYERFIVSPDNARDRLAAFIKGARRELLIYDPKVTDDGMLTMLAAKAKDGVDIRVIGKVESKWNLKAEKCPLKRLHIRTIIRDGRHAFIGSQSLRKLELEKRREIGVIVHDEKIVRQMKAIFEQDWAETDTGRKQAKKAEKQETQEKKNGKEPGRSVAASA